MRTIRALLVTVMLSPASALAQGAQPPAQPAAQPLAPGAGELLADAGEIDFGFRLTSVSGDPGRYQRMRDLRTGPTLDRLRYTRDRGTWLFEAEADHVGYRDQHYRASIERFGRFAATFDWDQIPLFYTDVTRSPFVEAAPATFRLDDGIQSQVQNQGGSYQNYGIAIERFDTRSRRDIGSVQLAYDVTGELGLKFGLTSTHRTGEQPWNASFGFSNANEVPLTVDNRSTDLTTAAEWSNQQGMVRVAYDGSWFSNPADTLVWDNPLRITDGVSGVGPSQGRMAISPDSSSHTVSGAVSMSLPARTKAFAYFSLGTWLQDGQLLAHTINTAIPLVVPNVHDLTLPRETAEAEARITSMNYRLTSRPTSALWLSAQYRLYDFDNRTNPFEFSNYVSLDTSVATSATGGSEPFSYTRDFVDLDASYSLWSFTAVRVGYAQERDRRTFRTFENTTDRTFRVSADSTGWTWGSARVQYDHSVRTGEGLDEQVLSDVGEQVSLRQFDISDRTRDRVSAIFQVVPVDYLGVNASISVGLDDRPDDQFGVLEGDFHAYTVGVDVTPNEQVTASVNYGFDRTTTRQKSRQASNEDNFNDPTRDWWTDMDQDVHTVGFRVDWARNTRTSVSIGYDYVGSRALYVYELAPNQTIFVPPAQLSQLPPVWNVFHVGTVDGRYTLTSQLGLGIGYRYERYKVDDFAFGSSTLSSPLINAYMNLMYQWRPYETHSGYLRLLYTW
jgi:MtrB/PioB family decaheme-associated outer membrane protein